MEIGLRDFEPIFIMKVKKYLETKRILMKKIG
jgi:hypothetical protein